MTTNARPGLYRTHLEEYAEKWADHFVMRRDDGILEVRMHSNGGPAQLSPEWHRALGPALSDINYDPDNEIVILTGTGDSFLNEVDVEGYVAQGLTAEPNFDLAYNFWYRDQLQEFAGLLDLAIPVIAAVNGPCHHHPDVALINDIVIASETTTLGDNHYSQLGMVPGDGVHTLFREFFGETRAKHALMTGRVFTADELLAFGAVSEVVPHDQVLDRAWEIAEKHLKPVNPVARRLTRALLVQPWREKIVKEIPLGMTHSMWATHGAYQVGTAL